MLFLSVSGGLDIGLKFVKVLFLRLNDLDEIGHNLLGLTNHDFGGLHDLDLKTEHTLTELDVSDGNINEIFLGLTSRDLVTLSVLLSLCSLSTNLTGNNNFATDGTTTSHDGSKDVVSSESDGSTTEELHLEDLNVGSSAEVSVVTEGFDGKINFVVNIVEVVSLLDEGLDFSNLTGVFVEEVLMAGSLNTDLGGHGGSSNLNTGVTLHTKSLGEELVKLSLEHTVGNELLFGINSSGFLLVSHFMN